MTTTAELLDAIATDWRPSRQDARESIRWAVLKAAEQHNGDVHIADVRPHLREWVAPAMVGAFIYRLASRGYLTHDGVTYRPNGDTSARNGNKPSPVWRLAKDIPMEETR